VVVLVRQLAATGAQRQALQEYVASGGSLVCSFGTGRWDYDPARTSQPYYPLVFLAGSSLLEWGELSETMQVGFVNDPKMIAGFHVAGHPSGAGHQILVDSAAQAGVPSIDMTASISDCPELVRTFSAAGTIPLLMYDQATTEQDGVRNAVSGSLAAWISNYYMGRVVYFGFQLHDLIRGGDYGSPETKLQARRLLANSVRWAMRDESYGRVYKGPVMTASGGMSSGKLRVSGRVANGGSVQIDGSMMVRVLDPRGRVVYENGVKRSSMTLAPGGSCSLDWLVPVGTKPAKGRWTAVVYYTYWDRFRGGAGVASRVAWFSSNGKTLTYAASPAQGLIAGALPPGGPSFAGADRYEVAAERADRAHVRHHPRHGDTAGRGAGGRAVRREDRRAAPADEARPALAGDRRGHHAALQGQTLGQHLHRRYDEVGVQRGRHPGRCGGAQGGSAGRGADPPNRRHRRRGDRRSSGRRGRRPDVRPVRAHCLHCERGDLRRRPFARTHRRAPQGAGPLRHVRWRAGGHAGRARSTRRQTLRDLRRARQRDPDGRGLAGGRRQEGSRAAGQRRRS
jgi:hypothetical protein